jgi:hypothetical protein
MRPLLGGGMAKDRGLFKVMPVCLGTQKIADILNQLCALYQGQEAPAW